MQEQAAVRPSLPEGEIHPVWHKVKNNKLMLAGILLIALLLLASLLAPLLSPYDPTEIRIAERFQPPSPDHWFGTDEVGRDIFTRILYGARLSLGIGAAVVVAAGLIGMILGTISGYFGGTVDQVIMRVMDMILAFPALILAMALSAALGPNLQNAMIAIAIVKIPVYVRLARGQALETREMLFVKAAKTFGIRPWRIIAKHIVPHSVTAVIIQITLDIGDAILLVATLGFLGLGAQPPTPEWGAMISVGWKYLLDYWWYPTFPGLALFLASGAFNLIGDGIRDILDPKSN
ncbi:peptide/nickel transport system permease protein [Planifilum fulgidum]|jgi:peptide/nickel transport system permease protein|uniref:Peptide/nickel transport system permease protein n=1 Tax=Planifilum fulgidum TaxID=201973 RepID=A0A1I2KET8_9BACL|nr:ABC transporter permease subunit [Planifilum fulgidum]MBO2495156.1 D-ala-D-ala transporter subunit [Bacillota bacterium]MBO2531770.1 D-ala-D-ala transporter subunit [Thermoactinomycetaceae bacterium]SFF64750.1 peptide/nickel transport system permease protein [Planifilum fulgidum]